MKGFFILLFLILFGSLSICLSTDKMISNYANDITAKAIIAHDKWMSEQSKTSRREIAGRGTKDQLVFPKDNFKVETKTVRTSAGEKKVTYHSYMHIPYVENPVDKDYQSLNVSVPVKVDDVSVDASSAPILFVVGVGGYMSVNNASADKADFQGPISNRQDLALAAGYTIVTPGCRGRDNRTSEGLYYGKAPAAIVDLKAAIRYVRHNKGILPGNTDRIISVGCSAGGALSALLGTSGNSPLYDSYLKEIGAADEKDNIFASGCFSPITDLEHADMAYEWNYGITPTRSGLVDQQLSQQLKKMYAEYQVSLNLRGKNGFGILTADNYDKFLLKYYLIPAANNYMKDLPDEKRKEYLANNKWITLTDTGVSFTFPDYVSHVGRMKGLPAFDDFERRQPEPKLFGDKTTDSRHFTIFSLQHSGGNKNTMIDSDLKMHVNMMNAMYFLGLKNSDCANYWWLRNGTSDNHTSQTVMINLATSLENMKKNVNVRLFWDGGHCADYESEEFIRWIGDVSGFSERKVDYTSNRNRLFNSGWKFLRDTISGAEKPEFDDSKWLTVDLPHDYSMMNLPGEERPDKIGPFSKKSPGNGNSTGHVIGGTGWYRKRFKLNKDDEGKIVTLNFDGVYMESEIWVNGKKAGIHKNGYTPFWFDITSFLNPAGEVNVIAIKVENTGRNSRWYSGSGIYRNVHLTLTQPVHIAEWGIKITTPETKQGSAVVSSEITTRNNKNKEVKAELLVKIIDRNGNLTGSANNKISIPPKSSKTTSIQVIVNQPLLWSPETPNLYSSEIVIKEDNKVADQFNQTFGIRSLEFSASRGFLLNGKSVKLKGGCIHHDNGLLGAAAFSRAEERKVEILKANGYNAVRCAHNPPSSAFLDACDRLGMLVIDEFTDMWEHYKNPQDYSKFFREWWNRDLTDMIMRDRNHPSVIMWSLGNEVYELEQSDRLRIGKELADRVKELDNTRAVTQSLTDFFYPDGWEFSEQPFALLDVCGYNYSHERYETDHQKFPDRIMYASESFPMNVYEYWKSVEKYPWFIGEFVWTAMDYIGEVEIGTTRYTPGNKPTIQTMPAGFKIPKNINIFDMQANTPSAWPAYVSGCGDIDLTGERKPQKLYRDILWDLSNIEINVHAPVPAGYTENTSRWGWPDERPGWNWPGDEGNPLQVRVFTKAPHVKLILNGKTIGEKDITSEDKYIALFKVPYQPGELKAIASENRKETGSKILKTPEEAYSIRLIPDRDRINADRNDLCFVRIEIVDKNGDLASAGSKSVRLTLSGVGELIASGNADPRDMSSVNKPVVKVYRGRAQAIIRPFVSSGFINLKAESDGLKTGEIEIVVE